MQLNTCQSTDSEKSKLVQAPTVLKVKAEILDGQLGLTGIAVKHNLACEEKKAQFTL